MVAKTQIYCRNITVSEAHQLVEIGTDMIAWDIKPEDGKAIAISVYLSEFLKEQGRDSVILIHSRKTKTLEFLAKAIRPTYLLLSSDRDDSTLEELADKISGFTKLMVSVPVRMNSSTDMIPSLELARQYSKYSGALILDTCPTKEQLGSFGCTGRTNDWAVGSEIVRQIENIPVLLAGGLSPSNVRSAIDQVKPYAVDACTSLENFDKSKNMNLCKRFIEEAGRK